MNSQTKVENNTPKKLRIPTDNDIEYNVEDLSIAKRKVNKLNYFFKKNRTYMIEFGMKMGVFE